MAKNLFIPGPVDVDPEIMAAMSQPVMGHRMPEYAALHQRVVTALQRLLNTSGHVFLVTSSAWGIMEGAVRNLVQKRCVNFANGAFSGKWNDVTQRCGKEADEVAVPWGEAITPELVDKTLASGKYDAMTLVHNETSTGVMSPLAEIAEVVKQYPQVAFIVDSVSAMSAVPLDFDDLGADVLLAGTQKAFALPPGLAVCAVSQQALDKAQQIPGRGYYFDLVEFAKHATKNNTPSTPCISLIHGLERQLERMFVEGLEQRFARHRQLADMARRWVRQQGFSLFPEEKYASVTLTCARNDGRTDLEKFKELVGEKGYAMDNGYGKIKNETFRIGHMGDMQPQQLQQYLDTLAELLPQVRH